MEALMLKILLFFFSTLSAVNTFAGYHCTTQQGDVIRVFSSFQMGTGTTVQSDTVSDYYKKNLKIEVKRLMSVIDPETKKYMLEKSDGIYLFGLGVEDSEDIGNIWSLEFKFQSSSTAQAVLRDMAGAEFSFALSCQQTPDLE